MKKTSLTVLVSAIAVHSMVIGIILIVNGQWLFAQFGWKPNCDGFFFHQVGVFHIVLGALYLIEFLRYGRVTSILLAKTIALVFLVFEYAFISKELAILWAGIGDGCIGATVAGCYLFSRRQLRSAL